MEFKRSNQFDIEDEMIICRIRHLARLSDIVECETMSRCFLDIATAINKNAGIVSVLSRDPVAQQALELFDKMNTEKDTDWYLNKIFEKTYVEIIQEFEYFILDCFRAIYFIYPILLPNVQKNLAFLSEGEVEDLIKEAIHRISNGLVATEQIDLFRGLNFNYSLKPSDRLDLVEYCTFRNLLIQNKGRITVESISLLRSYGIDKNYQVGENVLFKYVYPDSKNKHKDLIKRLINEISTNIAQSKTNVELSIKTRHMN